MGNRRIDLLKHLETDVEIQHMRQKQHVDNSNELLKSVFGMTTFILNTG